MEEETTNEDTKIQNPQTIYL